MSQHNKTDFKHFTKDEMDAGLKLHGLDVGTPSQLSDGFRHGAEWAISHKQGKRAPVQGLEGGIPWEMHLEAYDVYCKRYAPQKALIEGWCRGGFGVGELDMFIPGWREKLSEYSRLQAELAALQQRCKEHDQFRMQHQKCSGLVVKLQQARLDGDPLATRLLTDPL